MSIPDKRFQFDSLFRHEYGLSILQMIIDEKIPLNFSMIMEKLKISKRGLYMTLKDLEAENLIIQTKIGRKSFISITETGKTAIETFSRESELEKKGRFQEIINSTIAQLEKEGIISSEWTSKDRKDFIDKLTKSIKNQQV